jgi:predicted transposase/invertase (TIGR01784 family)
MKSKKNQKPTNTKRNKEMFYEKMYARYIDPFTDFGFKRLFGEEYNKDLLLDFLNELLYHEQGHIVSISYLNPEKLGITKDSRKAYYDLYCQNEKGEKFIVEIQQADQTYFKDRALFYSTFPIVEQSKKKKKWDYKLEAVYVIAILDFVFDEDKHNPNKYRYDIKLSDIETHKVFYDKLTFIYLEMPKFNKNVDELETRFEKWMFVIKNLQCLDKLPDELREYIFEKLFAEAEIAKLSPEEYLGYAREIKNFRDYSNVMDTAAAKGHAKGLAKGLTEGLAKGLAKGLIQGKNKEREKIVLNAHSAGFPVETITAFTGLTFEQITEILNQNHHSKI